ncbi:uncharacterized protein LOC120545095 [Perca fluviatilis]|uniref:uncharacterized protein LOC120545095 n=1 Tax=Perca fluviatilis TaxID=8168 RepID=UPI001962F8BB|nr:uncharacterized protein LOC120545095 [Perca fluviatilis]
MESSEKDTYPPPDPGPLAKRVLVAIYKDGTETCKKLFTVADASQLLQACHSEFSHSVQLERFLKYNNDFQDYVDCDTSTDVKDYDKFQVRVATVVQLEFMEVQRPHVEIEKNDMAAQLKSLLETKAPDVLTEHQHTGTLSTNSRKKLVKLSVCDLVEKHGFYPSTAEKLHLAKSLTTLFPSLNVMVSGEGKGFEHFYDPVSHKGLHRNEVTKYQTESGGEPARYRREGCLVEQQQQLSLQRTSPSECTQSPTVADIVQQYPRFIDIPSLLDVEFGRLFDGKAEMFIRRWESSIIPKLKQIAILEKGGVSSLLDQTGNQNDDELCYSMLQVLTHLLPPTASGRGPVASSRCSVKSAVSYLLNFVQHGTSIPSLCDVDDGSLRPPQQSHQPQLVCIGHLSSQARQFVIVARSDKVAIPLHGDSLTCALDKLFKFFWVCNVAYPTQLTSVFIFLEHIYDLPVSKTARRSKVMELIGKLQVLA